MQKISGLLPPWIQWTSLLTGYFSAMDNTSTPFEVMTDFSVLWTCLTILLCVCVCQGYLRSLLQQRRFSFCSIKWQKIRTEILPCICFRVGCHGGFQPEKWAKNVFFIAAGRSRVRSAHSHAFTHLGAVQYHQCHRVLLTDHLHQSLRSVCLRGLCLSEMRKEKIGPVQGEIKLSSCSVCVHTHTVCLVWLLLTAAPSPLLCSRPSLPLQQ